MLQHKFHAFASNDKLFSYELKILNYDEIRSLDWIKLIPNDSMNWLVNQLRKKENTVWGPD